MSDQEPEKVELLPDSGGWDQLDMAAAVLPMLADELVEIQEPEPEPEVAADDAAAQQEHVDADGRKIIWRGAERLRSHLVPINDLKPHPRNTRRGDKYAIAESLRRFGQVRAVAVTPDNMIVAGHHVRQAAILLGWSHLAAMPSEFESEEDALAYLVTDNALAQKGDVDNVQQMDILQDLKDHRGLDGTGFTEDDLDTFQTVAMYPTVMVPTSKLKPYPGHYRKHPEEQVFHLVKRLLEFGFYRDIVTTDDWTILAGHAVWEAAQYIGLKKCPVKKLPIKRGTTEARRLLAGDQEIATKAEVNDRDRAELLRLIKDGDPQGLLGTGFDAKALANLVFVSRSREEIEDKNYAAEWVGMPEWVAGEKPYRMIISFESPEGREEFWEELGAPPLMKNMEMRRTWMLRWPPRSREDLASLRFDVPTEDARGQLGFGAGQGEPETPGQAAEPAVSPDDPEPATEPIQADQQTLEGQQ